MAKAKNTAKRRAPAHANEALRAARKASTRARVLRIIGGRHRGRRLRFPDGVEIRPTPDRVRETLFNWLNPRIAGARVLDLFAGSGALGLEALSRGADHATFVERDRRAAEAIETIAREWHETSVSVVCRDSVTWLAGRAADAGTFDIVFLDPPYDAGLLERALAELCKPHRLSPDARVYLEHRAGDKMPPLPEGWRSIRDGRAGEVGYHLLAT